MSMVIRERTLDRKSVILTSQRSDGISPGALPRLLHLVAGIEATFAGLLSAWSGDNHAPLTPRR